MTNRRRLLAALGISTLLASTPSYAEPFKQLNNLAKDVTLPILTSGNGGSITIIGRNNSTYTFLTSAHVISGTARGEVNSVDLSNQTGKSTLVQSKMIKDFRSEGLDLAIGNFEYSGKSNLQVLPLFGLAPDVKWEDDPSKYQKVSISCEDESLGRDKCSKVRMGGTDIECYYTGIGKAPCDKPPTINVNRRLSTGTYERFNGTFNNKQYDIKTATIGDFVVAGYSLPTRAISERVLRISAAIPQNLLNRNKDGYNLIYESSSTVPGMSGGPVLAARLCPMNIDERQRVGQGAYAGIIGIHGQSEEYSNTGARSGISLAIPISNPVVIDYLTSNSKILGIPAGRTYTDVAKTACTKENTFY